MDYVKPEHIEVAAGLVDAAVAAGVAAPVPVRTPEGRVVVTVDGEHWRAHHRIPLGPMPTMPPAPELGRGRGTALGTLHAPALAPPGPVVPWLTYRRSEDDWEQLVDRARRAGVPWAEALATAVPGFVALDAVRDDRDPADRAIFSNCDLQPGATRSRGATSSSSPAGTMPARSRRTGRWPTPSCPGPRRSTDRASSTRRPAGPSWPPTIAGWSCPSGWNCACSLRG